MTQESVALEDIVRCRADIVHQLPQVLGMEFEELLVSVLEERPKWALLPYKNVSDYPGIRWKMLNIHKMSADRKESEIRGIRAALKR